MAQPAGPRLPEPAGPRLPDPADVEDPPASTAESQRDSTESSAYHLTAEVTTDFPVFVGAELTFELPSRLFVGGGIGGVPTAYLRVTSDLVTSAADLSGPETDVVTEALSGSWVGRLYVGWRPWTDGGLLLRIGYTALNLRGELADAEALAEVTDLPPAAAAGGAASLASTLHTLDAQIGYRWMFDRFTVRIGAGILATVGASATIDVESPLNPDLTAELIRRGEDYLEDIYRSYVFTPFVGVAVGYDFGF